MVDFTRGPWRPPLVFLAIIAALVSGGCGGGSSNSLPPTSPDDYLYNVLVNGNVVRWVNMPISVYIQESNLLVNWKPAHRTFVYSAMQEWTDVSEGKVSFAVIPSPSDPCVTVSWVKDHPLGKDPPAVGAAQMTIITISGREYVQRVEVEIATSRTDGLPLSDMIVRNASLHEMGHAIGLWGHSDDPNDIMYAETSATTISSRDKATLLKLYSLSPNVYEMPSGTRSDAAQGIKIITMP